MSVESKVLAAVLRLTKNGRVTLEDISRNTGITAKLTRTILLSHAKKGYLQIKEDSVLIGKKNRVQLAVYSIGLGADIERVCGLLSWDEFEEISVEAFESSGFQVVKHFRFKSPDRRWEIDLLGFKKPLVLSVDCKHWHKRWRRSSIMKIVESQVERTKSLVEASEPLRGKIGISQWEKAIFVPVILSLIPGPFKFYQETPVVSVLQIRDFLKEVFAHTNMLRQFIIEFGPSIDEY